MLTHPRLPREDKMMANWFWPACGEADNNGGPKRSVPTIGSPRATFHHGPERERSTKRPEIRLQSEPQVIIGARAALPGGVQILFVTARTMPAARLGGLVFALALATGAGACSHPSLSPCDQLPQAAEINDDVRDKA